jgi:hypothetical protein
MERSGGAIRVCGPFRTVIAPCGGWLGWTGLFLLLIAPWRPWAARRVIPGEQSPIRAYLQWDFPEYECTRSRVCSYREDGLVNVQGINYGTADLLFDR